MMKTDELRHALEKALQRGGSGKNEDIKAAFQTLMSLLADYPELPIDEFCSKARDGLKAAPKDKKATRSRASEAPIPLLRQFVIERYLGELAQTKIDGPQFEKVVERLKKDKEIRIGEAREIAKRFTGSARMYKTKPEAAKAILQQQISDVRTAGKLKRIGDIF